MTNKTKLFLISMLGILLVLVIVSGIFLMNIREDFKEHLKAEYPELLFTVGFTKIDPVFGSFYAEATCLNDNTVFSIRQSFNTKRIRENYSQNKSQNQYNSKIKGIFRGSDVESKIKSATGGGKSFFDNAVIYSQISVSLVREAQHISVVKEILRIIKANDIVVENILFTYEKNNGIYQILLSEEDYNMSEKEIEVKVIKIE